MPLTSSTHLNISLLILCCTPFLSEDSSSELRLSLKQTFDISHFLQTLIFFYVLPSSPSLAVIKSQAYLLPSTSCLRFDQIIHSKASTYVEQTKLGTQQLSGSLNIIKHFIDEQIEVSLKTWLPDFPCLLKLLVLHTVVIFWSNCWVQ